MSTPTPTPAPAAPEQTTPQAASEQLTAAPAAPAAATTTVHLLVIYGASGRTGHRLASLALAAGLRVRAFVRDPSKLPDALSSHASLEVCKGDLTDLAAVAAALDGATLAACVAGGRALSVDGGMTKVVKTVLDAMPGKGVTRFLFQAGAYTRTPGQKLPVTTRVARAFFTIRLRAGKMLNDVEAAVAEMTGNENVQWVVVRPGWIVEGDSRGLLKESQKGGATVVYDDLAAFNLEVLRSDQYNHKCIYPAYAA